MRPLYFAIAVLAAALVACSGGGSLPNGSVVNDPGGPTQPPTKLVNVKVTVTVPAGTNRHNVRPGYVSVNTQSLVIELSSANGQGVSGVNPTTIDTVAHAPGCKEEAGQTVCTATASGSPGDDVFAVTAYSGTHANGSVLSDGSVQAKVGSGGDVHINNLLLTLDGVIASLSIALSPHDGDRGKPANADVSLAAFDASGAQIVGPSHFTTPIALSIEGDTDKAFALHAAGKSGASLAIVKPTSGISLTYDGKRRASSVTVQAVVDGPGSIGASANFLLHGKVPPPPVGTIYALNLGKKDGKGALVTEYDGKSKGNAAPERTLSLSAKLYARTIAVDSDGNLYVGYLDNELGYNPGTGKPDAGNEIAIYAPGASGNAPPAAVLASNAKTDTNLYPLFISFDPSGRLVTYGATDVDGNNGDSGGAVLTYAAGSSGSPAPDYGFDFSSPYLNYSSAGPTGLAIDSTNNFYVNGKLEAGFGDYDYGLFVAPAADIGDPNTTPSRTIPWDSTTQLTPGFTTNVALNESGEILIANSVTEGSGSNTACQGQVNVFAAGATGGKTDVPPLRVLTLGGVFAKAGDCENNPLLSYFPTIQLYGTSLFVADAINNAIDAFGAGGHGVEQPSLQITGSATQLAAPVALVITSVSGQAKARSAHPPIDALSSIQRNSLHE